MSATTKPNGPTRRSTCARTAARHTARNLRIGLTRRNPERRYGSQPMRRSSSASAARGNRSRGLNSSVREILFRSRGARTRSSMSDSRFRFVPRSRSRARSRDLDRAWREGRRPCCRSVGQMSHIVDALAVAQRGPSSDKGSRGAIPDTRSCSVANGVGCPPAGLVDGERSRPKMRGRRRWRGSSRALRTGELHE
jgi:hypothetical protein